MFTIHTLENHYSVENLDFSGTTQTYTLSSDTTFVSPQFNIVNDNLSENRESFTASISTSAAGVIVSRPNAEVFINDNDCMSGCHFTIHMAFVIMLWLLTLSFAGRLQPDSLPGC